MNKLLCFPMLLIAGTLAAQEAVPSHTNTTKKTTTEFFWPDLAPGETDLSPGEALPGRPQDDPPITRLINIRRPSIDIFPATKNANGAAVVILPGGGFGRVVPDLEGSEAAAWLNQLGVTCFVVNYRTSEVTPEDEPKFRRPLQDGQRAIRWIRANAQRWNLKQDKIGLLAFSAGGQVGSIWITSDSAAYDPIDAVDQQSFRPDFAMLVYPWRCYDPATDALIPPIQVSADTPPTFLIHTHDDNSSSLGAALMYADLKRHNVPAELHIYETGGHGYGTRERPNSNIGTWTDRATDWLSRKL
ncbi:MAG: alpha/beta hydrolase [Pirellulaceae bacterium]|nr:alpha/beta hydrolase [Pirellulaceae bacterium]